MTTILHIGMAKTGTTQLQSTLMLSRAALLEAGILYPEPYGKFNNHRILVVEHLSFDGLPRHMRRHCVAESELVEGKAEFLGRLRSQVQEERPNTVVLSSESLFSFADEKLLRGVHDDLIGSGLDDIQVVVYVRRPSSHYLSSMQQRIRASHEIRPPKAPDYRGRIEACMRVFGRDRMAVRRFDRELLLGADIVTDFCSHFLPGIALESLTRSELSNDSLSAASLAILRRYRMDFYPDQNNVPSKDTSQLKLTLVDLDVRLGLSKPKLHKSVADAIDHSSADAVWLRDEFQIEFAGIDYGELEGRIGAGDPTGVGGWGDGAGGISLTGLGEVIKLDPEEQAVLLEELGRSRWAAAEEGRGKWVSSLSGSLVA